MYKYQFNNAKLCRPRFRHDPDSDEASFARSLCHEFKNSGKWPMRYVRRFRWKTGLNRVENGKEANLQGDGTLIITGNKFVVKDADEVVAAGTFKVIAGQSPKATESTYTEGPDQGSTFQGIYKVDGDTLMFRRAGTPEDKRPTEFKTEEGSGGFSVKYKRMKK